MLHQTKNPYKLNTNHRHQAPQKLHRSYDDLNNYKYESNHYAANKKLDTFHQPFLTSHNYDYKQMPIMGTGERHEKRSNFNSKSTCDIANCGKILWLQREWNVNVNDDNSIKPLETNTQRNWSYYIAAADANDGYAYGISKPALMKIRTNSMGLPYTPLPEERQAFLANQHAIHAALPLLTNNKTGIVRS